MTGLLLTHFGSSATDRKWNHYIDTQILVADDGSAFDPYKISNTYNNHSGYPYYTAGDCVVIHGESKNQCHHAGLMRVVLVPGFQTCDSSLSLVDDLSLFNWQCEEIQGGGGIRFVLRGFRPTKNSVMQLIGEYFGSVHRQLCPSVRIRDVEESESTQHLVD